MQNASHYTLMGGGTLGEKSFETICMTTVLGLVGNGWELAENEYFSTGRNGEL